MESLGIPVEVVDARPERQTLIRLVLAPGCTVGDALRQSGVMALSPKTAGLTAPPDLPVGVFGQRCGTDRVLVAGERVEIYRPLQLNPKDQRRLRAGRNKKNPARDK